MEMALPNAFRLGGVTLVSRLGKGGFGITYKAQVDKTAQMIALKEYFPSDFASRDADNMVVPNPEDRDLFDLGLQAFLKEANILRTLPRQPGLVRVRGAFERLNTAYCIMEYIEGDPMDRMLPRILSRHGHLPEPLIEQFVKSITAALAAVHHKRIIHRDVKPANVMIRRTGQPVLIDFGAARPYGKKTNDPAMFTRRYAPIELFPLDQLPKGFKMREGPWSDIYSLSVMLYEMVSQRTPPDAKTRFDMVQQNGSDPYIPVATAVSQSGNAGKYSPRLLKMIDYGCALLAEDRPADAMAFCRIYTDTDGPGYQELNSHAEFGAADKVSALWTRVSDARPAGFLQNPQPTESSSEPLTPQEIANRERRAGVRRMLGLIAALAIGTLLFAYLGGP